MTKYFDVGFHFSDCLMTPFLLRDYFSSLVRSLVGMMYGGWLLKKDSFVLGKNDKKWQKF